MKPAKATGAQYHDPVKWFGNRYVPHPMVFLGWQAERKSRQVSVESLVEKAKFKIDMSGVGPVDDEQLKETILAHSK